MPFAEKKFAAKANGRMGKKKKKKRRKFRSTHDCRKVFFIRIGLVRLLRFAPAHPKATFIAWPMVAVRPFWRPFIQVDRLNRMKYDGGCDVAAMPPGAQSRDPVGGMAHCQHWIGCRLQNRFSFHADNYLLRVIIKLNSHSMRHRLCMAFTQSLARVRICWTGATMLGIERKIKEEKTQCDFLFERLNWDTQTFVSLAFCWSILRYEPFPPRNWINFWFIEYKRLVSGSGQKRI